ncbi:putative psbP domain-containing protein 5, chloroplastic-like [Capsicum annuum]|nr:putative psbP domain-containing protein 5, chloroplastic-like [Capsicum annuum]
MEELTTALNSHMDQMADLVEKFSAEMRSTLRPAYDNFIGFFHAIDWTEPWLIGLLSFHAMFLLVSIVSRKNINFQMFLFLFALGGVYGAERLNRILAANWKSFARQNYFDSHGIFLSTLWSGPLLNGLMVVTAYWMSVFGLFSIAYWILMSLVSGTDQRLQKEKADTDKLRTRLRSEGGIMAPLGMVRCRHPDVLSQVARGIANFAKCESRASTQVKSFAALMLSHPERRA